MATRKQESPAAVRSDVRQIGRYIVADPAVCHGKPTFRGTRILVADVLEQVASGMAWETILGEWRGSLPGEAIAEAVQLQAERLASIAVGEQHVPHPCR